MSIFHLEFKPVINFFDLNDNASEQNYPTTNSSLNEAIMPGLISDRIKFSLAPHSAQTSEYKYDPISNRIHLWIDYGKQLTSNELAQELYNLDPGGSGPDLWMEGNIDIVDKSIAEKYGYTAIELFPYLTKISVLIPQQGSGQYTEHEIDINKLPKVF